MNTLKLPMDCVIGYIFSWGPCTFLRVHSDLHRGPGRGHTGGLLLSACGPSHPGHSPGQSPMSCLDSPAATAAGFLSPLSAWALRKKLHHGSLYDWAPGHQSRERNRVSGVTCPVWDDPGPMAPVPGHAGGIWGRCSVLCVFVMPDYSAATSAVSLHSSLNSSSWRRTQTGWHNVCKLISMHVHLNLFLKGFFCFTKLYSMILRQIRGFGVQNFNEGQRLWGKIGMKPL